MALSGFPRKEEIHERLGGHLPEAERSKGVMLEVGACVLELRQVVDSMRALFEELGLEDMRKV